MESHGVRLALVHLAPDEDARELFAKYGLEDVTRFSDPDKKIYGEFGLGRGSAGHRRRTLGAWRRG